VGKVVSISGKALARFIRCKCSQLSNVGKNTTMHERLAHEAVDKAAAQLPLELGTVR
jgi:hypothetical protein